MIEVTERFEKLEGARLALDCQIGENVKLLPPSAIWETRIVPKQNNLYADVSPYSALQIWNGMIVYVNNEDIVVGLDAKFPDPDIPDFKYNKYTRFALKFPDGSTKAYVGSTTGNVNLAVNFRPRIYKKVM